MAQHRVSTRRRHRESDVVVLVLNISLYLQKLSPRRLDPVRRTLCLTEATLLERDPSTYNIITLKPLGMVRSLHVIIIMSGQ